MNRLAFRGLALVIFSSLILAGQAQVIYDGEGQLKTSMDANPSQSNPALSLMGGQAQEVLRPKSPSELEGVLLNNFIQNTELQLPDDFGLEFMPRRFWASPKEKFTDADKHIHKPWRDLSISVASLNEAVNDSLTLTQLGFGLRVPIISGKIKSADRKKIFELEKEYTDSTNAMVAISATAMFLKRRDDKDFNTAATIILLEQELLDTLRKSDQFSDKTEKLVEAYFQQLKDPGNGKPLTVSQQKKVLDEVNHLAKEDSEKWKGNATKISDLRLQRYGWFLEMAGATFLDFPTGETDFSRGQKFGAWGTVSYRFEKINLEFNGMFRYIRDFQIGDGANNYDFGGGFTLRHDRISLAGEYLFRTQR
ncbi:MAG: hypothetical protein AAGB22_05650, partial [Bacteroidota bacterium]